MRPSFSRQASGPAGVDKSKVRRRIQGVLPALEGLAKWELALNACPLQHSKQQVQEVEMTAAAHCPCLVSTSAGGKRY